MHRALFCLAPSRKRLTAFFCSLRLVFAEIRFVACEVKHAEIAYRIEIIQSRRRAVEPESLAIIAVSSDALW